MLIPFLLVVALVALPSIAHAAPDETLAVWIPRAAGTTPFSGQPTASPHSFWLYAHQGVEYRAYAVATGGTPPYTWSLSGQPAGMTIDYKSGAAGKTGTNTQYFTGVISWPNPQASSGTITVTVTDALSAQASATWTVTVQSSKFVFVDCDATAPGSGTLANPYPSISAMYNARPAHVDKIVMFRSCAGTYRVHDMTLNDPERKDFHGLYDPMQWIAHPGETPVFDVNFQAGVTNGAYVRFTPAGMPVAWVGIDCINTRNQCLNLVDGTFLGLVADSAFSDQTGTDGENPAFVMTSAGAKNLTMIIRNDFSDYGVKGQANVSGSCIETYEETYFALIDNVCRDSVGADSDLSGFHLKGRMDQVFVYNNLVHGVHHRGIGGSNNVLGDAVIAFNRLYNCGNDCMSLNEFGTIVTPIHLRRNSIVGQLLIEDVNLASSGPFILSNNVHVATEPLGGCKPGHRLTCPNSSQLDRIVLSAAPNEDVVKQPSDNCVDSLGLLSDVGPDDCLTNFLGTKGAQVAATPPSGGVPRPPRNLTVR
ncbi:MAG: Ig domain-containing protein [Myxococcota bacterium]